MASVGVDGVVAELATAVTVGRGVFGAQVVAGTWAVQRLTTFE